MKFTRYSVGDWYLVQYKMAANVDTLVKDFQNTKKRYGMMDSGKLEETRRNFGPWFVMEDFISLFEIFM